MRWRGAVVCATAVVVGPALATTLPSCFEGGANFHQQQPGNNDKGGIDLGGQGEPEAGIASFGYGEIAVDPGGRYFLSVSAGRLIHGDLVSGAVSLLDVLAPARLAFAGDSGQRFFVTGQHDRDLVAFDARSRGVLWRVTSAVGTAGKLYPSADGRRLFVAGSQRLELRDTADGHLIAAHATRGVRDVDFTPDSARALVAVEHRWVDGAPRSEILVLDAQTGEASGFEVPNCASQLVLTPDGQKAFLAPTRCIDPASNAGKDPVSVIDLVGRRWLRNLPGFGPVAMAPDGVTAVAFIDTEQMDLALFDDLGQPPPADGARYHMMLLDTRTLRFASVELGDELPRYALTPDGKVVLVDSRWWGDGGTRIRILDVATATLAETSGPEVALDHFAITPDGQQLYLLYAGSLYGLSIAARRVSPLPTDRLYSALNITPDGRRLLLIDEAGVLQLYDPGRGQISCSMPPPRLAYY